MTKHSQNCHNTKAIAVLKEKGKKYEKMRMKIANSEYHPLQFTCGVPATPQYGYSVLWCAKIQNCTCTCGTHFGNTVGIPIPVLNPSDNCGGHDLELAGVCQQCYVGVMGCNMKAEP